MEHPMESRAIYQALARHLDSFPQGFPHPESDAALALLAYLFTPEEAAFGSKLTLTHASLDELVEKTGISKSDMRALIKSMFAKGLINLRQGKGGMEVALLPFIVGFYENQAYHLDETFARLFEDYFHVAIGEILDVTPQFHRIIPVNQTIDAKIEILPEQNVIDLLSSKKAWAVQECVCRKQKALIGEGCKHPLEMCLIMSDTPDVFENMTEVKALDLEGALDVLDQAAAAGLVHTVSNNKSDISYVCNCCTCSCGILRGIAEAHIANVVAKSAYVAHVTVDDCIACGICEEMCQFGAIQIADYALISQDICVGCGVCAKACPEEAITLSLRENADLLDVPASHQDWLAQRAQARSLG